MKKKALCLALSFSLFLPQSSFAQEESQAQETPPPPQMVGQAAAHGKTSAAAMAWAVVGISFLVVIGVVIAVTLAKDNH